jgi:hypothetical protein
MEKPTMAKANPKAWFAGRIAKITYRKVSRHEERNWRWFPHFPTWKEAHVWMLAKAADRLKKAKAELKSATSYHAKIKEMKEPTNG